jgi:hypothetical protein
MKTYYTICINNKDFEVSLENGKIYQAIPDNVAEKNNLIRVIDESGEDFLFPKENFIFLKESETKDKYQIEKKIFNKYFETKYNYKPSSFIVKDKK